MKQKRDKKVIVGICARDKKAKSKAMAEILGRLPKEVFEVLVLHVVTVIMTFFFLLLMLLRTHLTMAMAVNY